MLASVVEPLPDGEALLVSRLGRVVVAALGRHGPGQVEDLASPVVCPDGLERGLAPRRGAPWRRRSGPACGRPRRGPPGSSPGGPVAELGREGQGLAATVSARAQFPTSSCDLGQLEHRVRALAPARAAGRGARGSRSRASFAYEARAASAARARYGALPLLVVAVPEVMRQQVQLPLDGVRLGCLDVAADPAVEHRPHAERQALVGDLLGRDMLEEVGPIRLAIEGDEVGRAQGVELLDDRVEVAELRVRAGQHRRLEHAPDDAGDLERPARLLGRPCRSATGRGCAGSPAAPARGPRPRRPGPRPATR